MLEKIIYFIAFLFLISFCSCNSYPQSYFIPHEGNVAKLKEKNELVVSAGSLSNISYGNAFGTPGFSRDILVNKKTRSSFHAAYSPLKHLGVFGVHSQLRMVDNEFSNLLHDSHITGGGVGTYYHLKFFQRPPHKLKEGRPIKYSKILFDLYGGYTFGKLQNQYYIPDGKTSMNFQKFYLQGGVHWEGTHWGFSYVQKVGKVNYLNGVIDGQPNNFNDPAIQAILNKNNLVFTEATFRVDAKAKGVGVYAQLSTGNIEDFLNRSIPNPITHLGAIFELHEIRKLLKKEK